MLDNVLEKIFDIIGISISKTRVYNNQLWINCPFPHGKGKDRYPSMSIKKLDDNYLFFCTACKYKGNVYSLLRDYKGKSSEDIKKIKSILLKDFNYYLEQEPEISLPKVEIKNYISEAKAHYDKTIELPESAFEFYEKKGINRDILIASKARFNNLKQRIVFPIYSLSKKLVGTNERATTKTDRLKWNILNSFPKNEYLYLGNTSQDVIFICEGIGDVLKMTQNGYSSVAVFGSSISDRHIELLAYLNKKYYILFDGDQAGYSGTKSAIAKIGNRLFISWRYCYQGKDPGCLNRDDIENLLKV